MISFIDPALQAQFNRDGFVTVRLLDAARAATLCGALEAINTGEAWSTNHPSSSNYISVFDEQIERRERISQTLADALTPELEANFQNFTTRDHVIFVKPAHGGETALHQHAPLSDDPFETSLVVWCALTDCDDQSGALYVIPRSHHLYRYVRVYDGADYFHEYRATLRDRHACPVPLKAGEAIVMDNTLLHGAFPNRSDQPRLSSSSVLLATDARHAAYRRIGDEIVAMDPQTKTLQAATLLGAGVKRWQGTIYARYPDWSVAATLHQTEALLALAGPRASATYDPLEAVAHLGAASPAHRDSWRQFVAQIPGAVPAVRMARRVLSMIRAGSVS